MTPLPNNIFTITSNNPGPTVAIFGGVHGNERAGILAIDALRETLAIDRGTVYLVYANPKAITANQRLLKQNLNRLFLRGNTVATYEEKRANELMDLLDTCDALLDLHSYNDVQENANIFAICEENCSSVAQALGIPFRISGFTATEAGGSDGYMYLNNKVGVCVELGSINLSESMSQEGVAIAQRFLQYLGCIEGNNIQPTSTQTALTANIMYKKQTDDFRFTQPFNTLNPVAKGTVIAIDGPTEIIADQNVYILFPRTQFAIGTEAFILVNAVNSHHTHA